MEKIEVARRNLGVATELFLRDCDPVAVHTLTATAAEVLDGLARLEDRKPFAGILLDHNPDHSVATLKSARNAYWNAIKHVMTRSEQLRDDVKLLERFSDSENDWLLMAAWYDYATIVGAMPIEAQALQAWVVAKHENNYPGGFRSLRFHDLRSMSRKRQKEQLRRTIAKVAKNAKFMTDAKTEQKPLAVRTHE